MRLKVPLRILSENERIALNESDLDNRIGKNTKTKYQSGVNKFFKYCEARNLEPIPTEKNLCHFISETSREIKPTSANAYLSGISYHFSESYPEIKTIRMSSKLKNTVKGCQKTLATPTKRAEALTMLDIKIASDFFCESFDDLVFNSILALGFNGLHRLGELVEPDRLHLRDDRKVIKRWSLKIEEDESFFQYTLPYSKTDSHSDGTTVVIPARPASSICPVKTFLKYLVIRDEAFSTNPFLMVRSNGQLPCRGWFMKRLQQVFGNTRSGHSLRAGGATAYAQSGVRMETIQRMGRWKSDAFETYVHNHPLLNTMSAHHEQLLSTRNPNGGMLDQATLRVSLFYHPALKQFAKFPKTEH